MTRTNWLVVDIVHASGCARCDACVQDAITMAAATGSTEGSYTDANCGARVVSACQWFALCTNPATTTRPHPVLGDVRICDECNAKVDAIEGGTFKGDFVKRDGTHGDTYREGGTR